MRSVPASMAATVGLLLVLLWPRPGGADEALVGDLPAAFDTLAGRVVVAEALADIAEELRRESRVAALRRMDAEPKDEASLAATRARDQTIGRTRQFFQAIGPRLRGDSVMERGVKAFLASEPAADLVFDAWMGERADGDVAR